MKFIKCILGGAVLLQCLWADNYIVNPSYVELEPQNDPTRFVIEDFEKEILSFPSYTWTYGCTPTAYGMIIVYWANNYRDLYPELSNVIPEVLKTPTDIIPLVNHQWGVPGDDGWKLGDKVLTYGSNTSECQFIASRASSQLFYNSTELVNLTSSEPHVELCWTGIEQTEAEILAFCSQYSFPRENLGIDDHTNPDCIAAYCKSSAGGALTDNGVTLGFSEPDGKKSKKNDKGVLGLVGYLKEELGIGRFEIDGYSQYVNSDIGSKVALYSEPYPEIWDEMEKYRQKILENGFSWTEARGLIDHNSPFAVNLKACNPSGNHDYHTVTCFGYKEKADGTRFLRCKTTWSTGDADIPWEGTLLINGSNYAIYSVDVFTLDDIEKKEKTRTLRSISDSLEIFILGKENYISMPEELLKTSDLSLRLFTSSGFENVINPEIVNGQILIPPFELEESTEWIINHRNRICGEIYALNDSGQFAYREAIEVAFNNNTTAPSASVQVNRALPNMGFKMSASNDGGAVQYNGIVWDFGDGTKGRGYSVTHSYEKPGNYTVSVTMLGQNGETSTSSMNVDAKENITPIAIPNDFAHVNSAKVLGGEALLSLDGDANVMISVYSLRGQHVASIDKGTLMSGFYRVNIGAETNLSAGTYVVQVKIDSKILNSKIVLR